MKILIVEDDYIIQELIRIILKEYGECFTTETEQEAVKLFKEALDNGNPFDLVTLDIMLPGGDGHSILKRIRGMEEEKGIYGLDGVKIIMISALGDKKNILGSFREQCESYIVKPVVKEDLIRQMKELDLIS